MRKPKPQPKFARPDSSRFAYFHTQKRRRERTGTTEAAPYVPLVWDEPDFLFDAQSLYSIFQDPFKATPLAASGQVIGYINDQALGSTYDELDALNAG